MDPTHAAAVTLDTLGPIAATTSTATTVTLPPFRTHSLHHMTAIHSDRPGKTHDEDSSNSTGNLDVDLLINRYTR
ncbi:hypothetical protein E2C01_080444 [Portunus trituberculatus]|uniref:Uncharacterized protein n=1 Tax=Portunus trituberculatus TaxID=210409 RepID=A0A5B7IPA5_PORTR|nr:hypothetical protein [Portunus trituberculatus]